MPDGSYRMSITGVAMAIGTSQQNATNFLRSNTLKAFQSIGHTPQDSEPIEIDLEGQVRSRPTHKKAPV